MTCHTDVATANVLCSLPPDQARTALRALLEREPHVVGLQEWGLRRWPALRDTGGLRMPLARGLTLPLGPSGRARDYVWICPLFGGCPVGARTDRFDLLQCHAAVLGGIGRSDPGARSLPLSPPRAAAMGVFRDRRTGRIVSVISFHLTPGVQRGGAYRADRPRLVGRHRREVRALTRLVGRQLRLGRTVYAVGDSNFDGLRLPGLTSAWEGRDSEPGTLGPRRKIDDVHGPGPATAVTLLATASDHKAVLARRRDS